MSARVIKSTRNYKLFTRSDDNRDVNMAKHKKLKESMRRYGFLPCFPIVCCRVGGGLEVKDGQHRLAIAEELSLEVCYVEEAVEFDVAAVNCTAKTWQLQDYAEVYARNGNEHYAEGLRFKAHYRLACGSAFAILAGTTAFCNIQDDFVGGRFVVKDREWAHKVANTYAPMVSLSKSLNTARFMEACMACCRVEGFDVARLLQGAERQRHRLLSYSTRDAYLAMMEEVYNFGRKQLFGLKAAATQAMRDRMPPGVAAMVAAKKKAKAQALQPA